MRLAGVVVLAAALGAVSCRRPELRVAVVPRTTALTIWEAVHAGATFAADQHGIRTYWNAPTSEDDIQQQAALVERITADNYDGLILAPDQPLAMIAPVRRAIANGTRTVVIASPLPLPPSDGLAYIVNDDEATGRMAAERVGGILRGKGEVAVLGVNPQSLSELAILHAFETALEQSYPGIVIADRRPGTHSATEAQQIAASLLLNYPRVQAIFSLSAATSDGVEAALQRSNLASKVKLIGFEQSAELLSLIRAGAMDSIIAENTYEMGFRAMKLLAAPRATWSARQVVKLRPTLLTAENIDSPEAHKLVNLDWGERP